jgi:hypothetical protein
VSLEFEDLPTIDAAGRLGRRPAADSPVADAYRSHRPDPVAQFGSLALTLGLQGAAQLQQRLFPTPDQIARLRAGFQQPSYTMYTDCGPYNYNGTCNEACFGFAPDHMDPFFCATCAEQAADPTNNPAYNWHFVGSRGQIQYQDREPDVCAGRDAWKWQVGACGNCSQSAIFRCHDGYKKLPDNNFWEATICQGLVSCDNQLTPCP